MEGRGWRIGDLGSSLRNILVVLIIVGIYLRKTIECQSQRPKIIAMRAHIPSRNAQTWLLLFSAQVTQCRRPGERVQCRNRLVTSARGKKEHSRKQRDTRSDKGENQKTRIGRIAAAMREREKRNTKLNSATKVEESEMRRESRAKMKMDGT